MNTFLDLLTPSSTVNISVVSWQEAKIFAVPTEGDPQVDLIIAKYLKDLQRQGFNQKKQGIWIQSEWAELANIRGQIPASAASLTKIVTSLAAVEKLGINHRFITTIEQRGQIKQGVLDGDLVIVSDGDPFLTWEDGITLANSLQKLGIKQVKGDLLIVGNFYMNFQADPLISGEFLKKSFNWQLWSSAVLRQYNELPSKTPKPQLVIQGQVKVIPSLPQNTTLILRHKSLSLLELLKQMNIYSNNSLSQMLAESVGGAEVMVQVAQSLAGVTPNELQLINGSGLGVDNRISPRAVCKIWMALEKRLALDSVKISQIFPVTGIDKQGTLIGRDIPTGVALKTGTLNAVSALAGVISTQERGPVCFAILNHGTQITQLRHQQDLLLQKLSQHWLFMVDPTVKPTKPFLGDPSRNSF